MSVQEVLMKPGSWDVELVDTTPKRVRAAVLKSASSPAFFGHVVITGVRVADGSPTRTSLVKQALYMGVHRRVGDEGRRLGGSHILAWLGDDQGKGNLTDTLWGASSLWSNVMNYAWTHGYGWTSDAGNGIAQGTYHQNPTASATETTQIVQYQVLRSIIDKLSQMWGGMEYRVRTNSSGGAQCDFGSLGVNGLFKKGNANVCLLPDDGGRDGALIGLRMTAPLRYSLDSDSWTTAIAYKTKSGAASLGGWHTINGFDGSTGGSLFRALVQLSTDDSNMIATYITATRATNEQNHRTVAATVREYAVTRFITPGDEVLVHDPANDLVDVTVAPKVFRGGLLYPLAVRCTEIRWPIEEGMGVYLISGDGSNTVTDLTDYVAWETGATSTLTLGQSPRPLGPAMSLSSNSV